MKEFDYKSAWTEVILPEYERLTPPTLELYRQTCEQASGLHQDFQTLDMPYPDAAFRRAFEEIPSGELSRAAAVIYRYGHWSPAGHSYAGSGGTWKFSNYADQVLSNRLGLPRLPRCGQGVFFRVHEGILRVCLQTLWSWTSEEFGPAEPAVLAAAQTVNKPPQPTVRRNWRKSWEPFDADSEPYFQRVKDAVAPLLPTWYPPIVDTEKYMKEKVTA